MKYKNTTSMVCYAISELTKGAQATCFLFMALFVVIYKEGQTPLHFVVGFFLISTLINMVSKKIHESIEE